MTKSKIEQWAEEIGSEYALMGLGAILMADKFIAEAEKLAIIGVGFAKRDDMKDAYDLDQTNTLVVRLDDLKAFSRGRDER